VKTKTMFMACLLLIAGSLFQSTAQAQDGNPKIKVPNNPVILPAYLPDLRINSVKVNGIKADVEVWNRCKGDAPASRLRVELYAGSTKESGVYKIFEIDVPPIAGETKTTVTPDATSIGGIKYTFEGKYYRLSIDPHDKIKETVEGNNWFEKNSAPFPDSATSCEIVKPPPAAVALPDLRITKVTINGHKMFVEITNQCKGNAPANRLRLSLYGGPQKGSPGGEELEADVPAINAGAKATVTFDLIAYSSKFTTFGDKYYRLDVDSSNKVKEMIEDNNWWEKNAGPFPDPANECDKK